MLRCWSREALPSYSQQPICVIWTQKDVCEKQLLGSASRGLRFLTADDYATHFTSAGASTALTGRGRCLMEKVGVKVKNRKFAFLANNSLYLSNGAR